MHFDGTAWFRMDLGVDTPIVALSDNWFGDLWACGHAGGLWHRSGTDWDPVYGVTGANLYALGYYRGMLHVGGQDGALHRYQRGGWEDVGKTVIVRDPGTDAPVDCTWSPTKVL